jgi:hypothetical protein
VKGSFGDGSVRATLRRQNVERYRHLLEGVTQEPERQRILKLLAEEQQKQKDAGDPLEE